MWRSKTETYTGDSTDFEPLRKADSSNYPVLHGPGLRRALVVLLLVLADLLVGLGALGAMVGVGLAAGVETAPTGLTGVLSKGALPGLALWIMVRLSLGLYPGYETDPPQELRLQTQASAVVLVVACVAALAAGVGWSFYLLLPIGGICLMVLAPAGRYWTRRLLVRMGLWGRPVVVVGDGGRVANFARAIFEDRTQSFRPAAVFHRENIGEAAAFARDAGINTVILVEEDDDNRRDGLSVWARTRFERVVMVTGLMGLNSSAMVAHDLLGVMGIEMDHNLLDARELRVKRVMDLGITLVGGALVLPIFLLLALLVWFETRGSIFYTDQRLGRNGSLFSCIKFRTMIFDAEDALQQMLEEDHEIREEYSKYHKLRYDPRVTRIGRFLRKTSLDELPQLWNVLRGEMSLVGPRPYLPRESVDIGEHLQEISRVYPGITGPWQVSGRSQSSFEQRVEMDVHYIRNWSVWLDLLILARTASAVLSTRGAR